MRCPKCGAFMEDDREVCLMCGVNVKTYVPQNNNNYNNNNINNFNNNATFGSGSDFSNPMNVNPNMMNSMGNRPNVVNNNSNFYVPQKKDDKDVFDFYHEHKKIITIVLFSALLIILIVVGNAYYKHRNKLKIVEPVIQNLYFEVDKSFETIAGNSNTTTTYVKSGEKGNTCSIIVSFGSTISEDHVYDYFKAKKEDLEPELDSSGNVINKLDIYTPQDGEYSLNNITWHYLNVFYKPNINASATKLKYRYLTALYKGYYYDIELINNSSDLTCNAALDDFAKSLKFIES